MNLNISLSQDPSRWQILHALNTLAEKLPKLLPVFATLLLTACASTKVTNSQQFVTGHLARPSSIWIYDFAASPSDIPPGSPILQENDLDTTAPQTAEEIAAGHQLGAQMAIELAAEIEKMGLAAFRALPGTQPQVNDIVIRGYLISIKEGSAAKRVLVGFGSGGSQMSTIVEGYQMTPQGLRHIGVATVESGSSKTPGTAVGVATFLATSNPAGLIVSGGMKAYGEASGSSKLEGRAEKTVKEISERLKERFQEQGWIR